MAIIMTMGMITMGTPTITTIPMITKTTTAIITGTIMTTIMCMARMAPCITARGLPASMFPA